MRRKSCRTCEQKKPGEEMYCCVFNMKVSRQTLVCKYYIDANGVAVLRDKLEAEGVIERHHEVIGEEIVWVEETCEVCKGERMINRRACPECNGTGKTRYVGGDGEGVA